MTPVRAATALAAELSVKTFIGCFLPRISMTKCCKKSALGIQVLNLLGLTLQFPFALALAWVWERAILGTVSRSSKPKTSLIILVVVHSLVVLGLGLGLEFSLEVCGLAS